MCSPRRRRDLVPLKAGPPKLLSGGNKKIIESIDLNTVTYDNCEIFSAF